MALFSNVTNCPLSIITQKIWGIWCRRSPKCLAWLECGAVAVGTEITCSPCRDGYQNVRVGLLSSSGRGFYNTLLTQPQSVSHGRLRVAQQLFQLRMLPGAEQPHRVSSIRLQRVENMGHAPPGCSSCRSSRACKKAFVFERFKAGRDGGVDGRYHSPNGGE